MKLDDKQRALKAHARQRYQAHKLLEAGIDLELAALKVARLAESRAEVQSIFSVAIEGGVPKRQIYHDAMGVKDAGTLDRFMEGFVTAPSEEIAAAPEVDTAAPEVAAPLYGYAENGNVIVRLDEAAHRAHFDSLRSGGAFSWTWTQALGDFELSVAEFEAATGEPVTTDWLAARHDRHPLVVLYTTVPELVTELRAQIAEEKAA